MTSQNVNPNPTPTSNPPTAHRHALWVSHDPWLTAYMLCNGASLHHVEVQPGRTAWLLDHPYHGCYDLARRFREDRGTLTVPLRAFHDAYNAAVDAARNARRDFMARMGDMGEMAEGGAA